jgi:hypothetical protein
MYILEKVLSYQRLILVVQKKSDGPISKTGLPDFRGFKPPGQNLHLHHFLLLSPSLSQEQPEGDPKTPIGDSLVPLWNLGVLG